MPRTAQPMTSISAALQDLRRAMEGLVADHATMRQQLQSLIGRGAIAARAGRGRSASRAAVPTGDGKKRGRAFKFSDEQAMEFRKQAEGGKSAVALAKEL